MKFFYKQEIRKFYSIIWKGTNYYYYYWQRTKAKNQQLQ